MFGMIRICRLCRFIDAGHAQSVLCFHFARRRAASFAWSCQRKPCIERLRRYRRGWEVLVSIDDVLVLFPIAAGLDRVCRR